MMRFVCASFLAISVVSPSVSYADLKINPYPNKTYSSIQPAAGHAVQKDMDISMTPMPPENLLDAPAGYWSVRPGQDLRSVLKNWSERQDIKFIWDIPDYNFATVRGIEISGGYEEAVRILLDQYRVQSVRPVARLYLPNEERKKTLVVSLQR